ncbi:MAG: B12-binding domain-containing protein, partial [Caldilineaceae bacterium]|nr:B12-binding domain-containing protein [Caldilineaceae bacterium]
MPADPATLAETNTMSQLREAWISACINFDEFRAEQFLLQAFALFPAEVVCLDLLQKGLHQIGEGWYQGTITVQQEHFASALAVRRMEALLSSTPAPTRPGRILVGCPPEEEHTFVPLLLSLLLRRRGWDVIYLGANVPLRSLELTLSSVRPNLVILTAQQLYTASNLLVMAEMLFNERVPLAFGGLIFNEIPDLTMVIPGHYLGDRLELATVHVEQVMTALRPQPARRAVGYDYKEALEHFRTRQAPIEAEIWEQLDGAMSRRLLAMANEAFGRNITAALTLGNMDYLTASFDWIQGLLLTHYQMATTELWHYLDAYYMAALHHLEQPGYLILEWLSRLARRETAPASHQTMTQEQK